MENALPHSIITGNCKTSETHSIFARKIDRCNQKLGLHPHVHCVIPAGGLSLDHRHWVAGGRLCHLTSNRIKSRTSWNSSGCSASLARSRPPNANIHPRSLRHCDPRDFRVPNTEKSLGENSRRDSIMRGKNCDPFCLLWNLRSIERSGLGLLSGTDGAVLIGP